MGRPRSMRRKITVADVQRIVEDPIKKRLTLDEVAKILEGNMFRTSTKLDIANVGMIYG